MAEGSWDRTTRKRKAANTEEEKKNPHSRDYTNSWSEHSIGDD